MSKIRSDSIWNSLPAEQREKMVHWLFVECIGYKEASERGLREFGVTGSETSVGRFYRRIQKERAVNDLKELVDAAAEVNAAPGTLKELRASAMKMTGMRMLEKAMANGDVTELAALGHVLTECEEREIQRGRLALARKKFEFKAAKEALKVAPKLNKLSERKQAQADAEIVEAREAMFGDDPEGLYYEDDEELYENGEWQMTNDQGQMTKENPVANKEHLSPALVPTTASCGEGDGCAAGCRVGIENSSAAGESCVAAPEDGRTPKTLENSENSEEKSG